MKNKCIVILIALFFLSLSVWNILGEKNAYSESERRALQKFPETNMETILNGEFADEFEDYAVDHFPARDMWRSVKANVKNVFLAQKDNHGLFVVEKHLSKLEYPMNTKMLDHAVQVFTKVKNLYLDKNDSERNTRIYLAVIPDKNRYIAKENGYLSMDYDAFSNYLKENMDYATYIEIADYLDAEDYYYTDSHWRQEKIVDVAKHLNDVMSGGSFSDNQSTPAYEIIDLNIPFYGVYVGQSAMKCEPDHLICLSNDTIEALKVEGANAVYDMGKANGRDPYEMFLSGNQPVVTLENPLNDNGRRLIVFRDSYGASIAPLLAEAYSEVVLVDLRYVSSEMVGQFVDFGNADVLFLYSTTLLNNSLSLK